MHFYSLIFKSFSEWCDLNTRLSIPKTDTLPTALHSELLIQLKYSIAHYHILWLRQDLNLQLSDYDSETLPIELPSLYSNLFLQKIANTSPNRQTSSLQNK